MIQRWSNQKTCRAVGRITLQANCWLAVWFCCFGAAIAVGLPGSMEERFSNLLLLGLIPAAGLIVSGYALDQALKQGCKLCQIIATRVARAQILGHGRKTVGNWLHPGRRTVQVVFNARLQQFRFALVHFPCLFIRNAARFILKGQNLVKQYRYGVQRFETTTAP